METSPEARKGFAPTNDLHILFTMKAGWFTKANTGYTDEIHRTHASSLRALLPLRVGCHS